MRIPIALVPALVLAVMVSAAGAGAQAPAIAVDRARAGIPLGTSMTINVAGTTGPLTVQASFDGVDTSYDPLTHRLLVTGRAPGNGTLTLTDRNGNTATIAVLVGLPAGVIPTDVDVALAGTVSAPFVAARIRYAIEQALVRQPGTGLDVHGITIPPTMAPGDRLEAQAGVTLDGHGTYVDTSARTAVHVHVDALPPLDPAVLYYSDDPEYVGPQVNGTLVHGRLDAQTAARIFAYHVAAGAARRMWLLLGAASAARVQVLGTISGASSAFTYIGQQSSARFLAAHASGESAIVSVGAGAPYAIGFGLMQPGDLIEAIEDLRVVSGGPVDFAVVTSPADAPLPPLDATEIPGDSHGRRGAFGLSGVAPIDLTYAAGSPDPAPVSVGDGALPNIRAGQRPLGGDYGVVRPFTLHLTNPAPAPVTVFLYELTSGSGGATATLWFAGDPAATLVPCVDDSVTPHLIKAFTLAPGAARTVSGAFMTDGSSSYPIRLGLTATPPAAVSAGACGATPPPAP